MENYQQEGEAGVGGKGTGNKKHNWQDKIDRGRLRVLQEMEKPKTYMHNLWTQTKRGVQESGECRAEGDKVEKKNGTIVTA